MHEKPARWEEPHRQTLQAGYDYLKKTGFWLDFQELGFGPSRAIALLMA